MTAAIFGAASSGALLSLFARTVYSGNSSTQTITTNVDNDLVWIKPASVANSHQLFDSARGTSANLITNSTAGEGSISGVTAFNATGFALGSNAATNDSGKSYNSFVWKKQANYFDIVPYTGTGSNQTISHNLGTAPALIIVKSRSLDPSSWAVYHSSNTGAPETDFLLLNSANATSDDNTYWNDTAPTSSVFSVGTNNNVNKNGDTYAAYLFAASSGYSAFGTYTGNGSSQTINLGFQPVIAILRNTSGGDDWLMMQSNGKYFIVNSTDAEANLGLIGSLSATGISLTNSDGRTNQNLATYIYMAWR